MTAWPPRRKWQQFDSADLLEAIAIIESRPTNLYAPVDTLGARTVAALRAELGLREPNGPTPDSAGRGPAEKAPVAPGNEITA